MKAFLVCSLGLFALAHIALASDAEGCADLKAVPRLEGCIIQECSARQHDSFDADAASGSIDATVNALTYTCPKPMDLARVKRELDAKIRKAGYLGVAADKITSDPANPGGLARKGSEWLRWNASEEDGSVSYTIASAGQTMEACSQAPTVPSLKQCQMVECASKDEDSVAMKTSQQGATSLTGNVQTFTLSCAAGRSGQASSTLESDLRASGFEILFHDGGEITARSGKHWMGVASAAEGESVSYAITVVPSAEVLTASKAGPEPAASEPAARAEPALTPAPAATVTVPDPAPQPEPAPAAETPVVESASTAVPSAPAHPDFVPPKPVTQVQIEATHDRIYSVGGDVVISLLVDVDAEGGVTRAEVAGRVTKDVRKLEAAAIEAVSRWRFEPARQDGRAVPAVKIPVQMHFHGHPWQF